MSTEGDQPAEHDEAESDVEQPSSGEATAAFTPIAPLTMADLGGRSTPATAADARPAMSGWGLLGALGLAAAVLLAVVVLADVPAIADEGWRDNAIYATAVALGLLGLGVGAVAWVISAGPIRAVTPRVLTLVAVLGAFAGAAVVGLADQQGGTVDESGTVITPSGTAAAAPVDDRQGEPPIGLRNALEPAFLTESAIPIVTRTLVQVDLNLTGRQLVAGEMGCRPADLAGTTVAGTAIGGTWAEPLVVLNPPLRENGDPIVRCRRVLVRIPIQAGLARPFS